MVVSLLRLVCAVLLVRFAFRFLAAIVRGYQGTVPARPASAELVRDRVCNTFLPRDRALRAMVGGHEEHFCSAACRDQALRLQPAR
jgi:hypothetical protein